MEKELGQLSRLDFHQYFQSVKRHLLFLLMFRGL